MPRNAETIGRDAIAAGGDITAMLGGMTQSAFIADRKTLRATERSFEIIGEACSRLTREFPTVAAQVPDFRRVIDFRNVLAHGYDTVDPRLVFDLAQTRLPSRLAALRAQI